MGVRRLFSRGGQNFPVGGKNILFALKMPKNIIFSTKKVENILFCPAKGGQVPPLALPCGRPCQRFISKDPKSTKRLSSHQCLFALLGSSLVKAACKMLVKSTPGVNVIKIL